VRRQNEGSFGCEAVARGLGQPNVPECAVGFLFLLCLYAANFPLWLCLFTLVHNGSALGVRAGFRRTKLSSQHKSPIEKLNLNLTTSPRMTPNAC